MNGSQNMAGYGMIQGILGSGKDLLSLSMPEFNDDLNLKGVFKNDAKKSFGINKKLKEVGTPNVNDPSSAYLGNQKCVFLFFLNFILIDDFFRSKALGQHHQSAV